MILGAPGEKIKYLRPWVRSLALIFVFWHLSLGVQGESLAQMSGSAVKNSGVSVSLPVSPSPATSSGSNLVALRCSNPQIQKIALTFDDGPYPGFTRQILAILHQEKVKATFFVLGSAARKSPDLIRHIAAGGHLLASHSWDHPRRATLQEWRRQIQRTAAAIMAAGVQPAKFFRPPHGIMSAEVRQVCQELGYSIVLYTVLSSDWTHPRPDDLVKQVVRGLGPGGIAVLHDGGGDRRQTVLALPEIIRGLRRKGLQPVRLDELIGPEPRVFTCASGRK